jgi:hypothetical protein
MKGPPFRWLSRTVIGERESSARSDPGSIT